MAWFRGSPQTSLARTRRSTSPVAIPMRTVRPGSSAAASASRSTRSSSAARRVRATSSSLTSGTPNTQASSPTQPGNERAAMPDDDLLHVIARGRDSSGARSPDPLRPRRTVWSQARSRSCELTTAGSPSPARGSCDRVSATAGADVAAALWRTFGAWREGSWRRIACSSSRSASPGSTASSSTNARRACWKASSASRLAPAPIEGDHQLTTGSLAERDALGSAPRVRRQPRS